VLLDRVVQKVTVCGQLLMIAECRPQRILVIAIPGHQVKRRLQWRQQLSKQRIFLRRTVLRGIPGKDHRIRTLPINVSHAAPQAISPQTRCGLIRLLWQDVGVADLGD
jgi:hypothetical protein